MRRFLVFRSAAYHPQGGWKDFAEGFDGRADAIRFAEKCLTERHEVFEVPFDCVHVVDLASGKVVWDSEETPDQVDLDGLGPK